jgi:hypothetical protein
MSPVVIAVKGTPIIVKDPEGHPWLFENEDSALTHLRRGCMGDESIKSFFALREATQEEINHGRTASD